MAIALRDARRAQGRVGGRDQEGLPQAGPPVPPRCQSGRRGGGGAVQADQRGVRHAVRSREAQAVRHVRADVPAGPGSRAASRPRTSAASRASIWATCSAGCSPAAGAAPISSARCAARTSRWRCGSRSTTPCAAPRVKVPVAKANSCTNCHGSGAAPGTSPTICPNCKGRGRDVREPGLLLAQPHLPHLRRRRHRDRDAVRRLRRQRPRAVDQDLPGADPGRRQGWHPDQGQGQGRGGAARRRAGRPVRRSPRWTRARRSRGEATIWSWRCR